jgi:hypothetical protein
VTGVKSPLHLTVASILSECNRLWLLKKSVLRETHQNPGIENVQKIDIVRVGKRKSGVNSGVSWFWDSLRARALWCSERIWNLLILLHRALARASVRLDSQD